MSLARWLSRIAVMAAIAATGEIVEMPERGFLWSAERAIELQSEHLPPRRRVLLRAAYRYLAERANSIGVCWPGYGRIAKGVGCDRRSAIRAVKWLAANGWILVHKRQRPENWVSWDGYRFTSNVYWVQLEGPAGLSDEDFARAVYKDAGLEKGAELEPELPDDADELPDEVAELDEPNEDGTIAAAQAKLVRERETRARPPSVPRRIDELPDGVRAVVAPPRRKAPPAAKGDRDFVAFESAFHAARLEVYGDSDHGNITREKRAEIASFVQDLVAEARAWAEQRSIEVDHGALRAELCGRMVRTWLRWPGTNGFLLQKRHAIGLIVGDLARVGTEALYAWKEEQRAPRHPPPAEEELDLDPPPPVPTTSPRPRPMTPEEAAHVRQLAAKWGVPLTAMGLADFPDSGLDPPLSG